VRVEGFNLCRASYRNLDRVALKGKARSGVSGGSSEVAPGFCGPCVYLGVFLLF
jgi:hypothetical protein